MKRITCHRCEWNKKHNISVTDCPRQGRINTIGRDSANGYNHSGVCYWDENDDSDNDYSGDKLIVVKQTKDGASMSKENKELLSEMVFACNGFLAYVQEQIDKGDEYEVEHWVDAFFKKAEELHRVSNKLANEREEKENAQG